ncbi:MAG: helical backbone metal receptor, partial [Lautropia sp.]
MIGRWTGRWTGRWHRVAAAPLAAAGIVAAALFAGSPAAAAEAARGMPAAGPVVVDDLGRTVQLAAPARRVVALTPALVELAFAAGGGDRRVAAVAFSDSPEAARALPRIGDAVNLDLERVLALAPDLILAWEGGTQPALLARVAALGVPVYSSRIERLDGIATTLERLATLFGLPAPASAATVRQRLAALPARGGIAGGGDSAASRSPVRVFYQVWERP